MRRRPTGRATGLIIVVIVSASVVVALGGTWLLLHPGRGVFGRNPSNDFQIMAWSLRFWPWVLAHGEAPWHTSLLWAPGGFSTIWLTSIPGPALLALPITVAAGPIVAYNVLVIAAVCAASAAAFLLCWELTAHVWASVAGGLLFGLSPYMLGHAMSEHLNLLMVFPLPLLALFGVRYARGHMTRRRFVAASAVLLLFLAASSLELLADATLVLVLLAALGLLARSGRTLVKRFAPPIGLAYAWCAPLLVPVALLGLSGRQSAVTHAPASFSTDLLNVVVPTATTAAGAFGWAERVTSRFVGNIGERDGYLGLPLLAICTVVLWHRRRYRPLGALLGVAVVLSLGPVLDIGGRPVVSLPDRLDALPVLGDALPARFAVFAFLAAAPLAAVWLGGRGRTWLRLAVAVFLAVSLVPNFRPAHRLAGAWAYSNELSWSTRPLPAGFVSAREWHRFVRPGANVLVLPTADRTAAQWWQAEADMHFTLAVPETPFVPPRLAADPTVARLVDDVLPQLDGVSVGAARLRAFLRRQRVTTVAVTPPARREWLPLVRRATARRPASLHGDLLFAVPPALEPLAGTVIVADERTRPWLHVRLTFAGAHGRVFASVGRGRGVSLSPDTAQSATAVSADRQAVVAMVDATRQREDVRLARLSGDGWRIATLDRNQAPIWSLHAAITPAGTAIAGWVDETGRDRRLLVADARRGARWHAPVQLDAGNGLGSFRFVRGRGDREAVVWRDAVGNEWRLLVARYHDGVWSRAAVVATSLGNPASASLSFHRASPSPNP